MVVNTIQEEIREKKIKTPLCTGQPSKIHTATPIGVYKINKGKLKAEPGEELGKGNIQIRAGVKKRIAFGLNVTV